MKVGIIGGGQVAKALGRGFVEHGHQVMLSSRSPEKLGEWTEEVGEAASAGSFAEAAEFGELACLCTAWSGTENALGGAGADRLAGKVVIDVTNPLDFGDGQGPPTLAVGHTDSAGEQVQRWLPDSKVVKAFNVVGNQFFADPEIPGGPPTMFIGGDDEAAKTTVAEILEDFGWEWMDLGGIDASRYLEPLAMVWIVSGIRNRNFDQAVKMLRA